MVGSQQIVYKCEVYYYSNFILKQFNSEDVLLNWVMIPFQLLNLFFNYSFLLSLRSFFFSNLYSAAFLLSVYQDLTF